jgi:hypothetical protein
LFQQLENFMQLKTSLLTLALGVCLGLLSLSTAAAQNPVPFKLAGTATWDNLADAFPSEAGPAPGATFADGAGQASHLGQFTANASLFATGAIDEDTGEFPVIGCVTLVAANGDELDAMFGGDLNAVTGSGVASFEFTGGTGRFEDATGGGELQAYFDLSMGLENVPMVVFWDGVIDY